jgi:hypothetical protein
MCFCNLRKAVCDCGPSARASCVGAETVVNNRKMTPRKRPERPTQLAKSCLLESVLLIIISEELILQRTGRHCHRITVTKYHGLIFKTLYALLTYLYEFCSNLLLFIHSVTVFLIKRCVEIVFWRSQRLMTCRHWSLCRTYQSGPPMNLSSSFVTRPQCGLGRVGCRTKVGWLAGYQ